MRNSLIHPQNIRIHSAIEVDATNPVFYCNRAAAHCRLFDYRSAEQDCVKSLELDPTYSKAYGRLGIAYSKLDKHAEALAVYKEAVRLDPQNADYANNLAVTQERLRELEREQLAGQQKTAAAGGLGGFPGLAGLPGNLGGLDLSAALSNPDLMNMAQRMMTDPAMQDIMQSLQAGGGLEGLMDA